MMSETQRDEMIDLENAKTELLEALKAFAESGKGVKWEFSRLWFTFYPVNSGGKNPLTLGDIKKAMETYKKYGEG